jgi:hypothetical protein
MFGAGAIGVINEDGRLSNALLPQAEVYHVDLDPEPDEDSAKFTLQMPYRAGERFRFKRRRCPRGEWASLAKRSDNEGVEGDLGGWRYEWTV